MKVLRRTMLFIVLLILVLVVVGLFSIDGIIRKVVQSQGTVAVGQKTTLADASLSFFAGKLGLNELTIYNPAGYANKRLLTMKSCRVEVNTHSLLGKTVTIKTIFITGLKINIDQKGLASNISQILDFINHQEKPAHGNPPSSNAGGKQLQIDKVILSQLTVHLDMSGIPGMAPSMDFPLKQIEIDQPTNPNGRPLRIADLIKQVLIEIVAEAVHSGKMPDMVNNALGGVNSLLHQSGGLLGGAGKAVDSSLKNLFGQGAKP